MTSRSHDPMANRKRCKAITFDDVESLSSKKTNIKQNFRW